MGFNYSSKVVNFLLTQIKKNILIACSLFFTLVLNKFLFELRLWTKNKFNLILLKILQKKTIQNILTLYVFAKARI